MNPSNAPQPLRLMLAPPSGGRTAALFVSGAEPSAWLEEICAWQMGAAQTEIHLYVLPRTAADRRPAGVLAVLPPDGTVPVSARAQPYRMQGQRLYLPINARLDPPVSDEELDKLCRDGAFVLHPGAGLCRLHETDALSVMDLLAAPVVGTQNWAGAHPGQVVNEHLRSVRLEMPTHLEALFGDAAQEIGVDAPRADSLPPAPDEAETGFSAEMNRKIQAWLARLALSLTGLLPRTALAPNLFNRLETWASRHLTRIAGDLSELRHRELHRLLHLLEKDPDAGLRRALPLAGGFQRRGRAQPGGRLGQRDPNFRLGALGGGKAADPWEVPPELQIRLRERYLQLANEEGRLGRHQRAAYIHAELLGDLSAAAACLKQGQHYHEAAVLYRDHLRRPLEAADCLAAGGEFAEAIAIYEEHQRFRQAAGLYAVIGDHASAAAAYRREVDRLIGEDDLLAAAGLLDTELSAPEEAIALLRRGWPGSKQAGRCLEKAFELLAARGSYSQAMGLISDLADKTIAPAQVLPLARQLAAAKETYPDENVRHAAQDLAQVTVAARLSAAPSLEVRSLVEILGRLAPQDFLLQRDGNRYLAQRQEEEKRRPVDVPTQRQVSGRSSSQRNPRQAGSFSLPKGTRWQQVRSKGNHFYAAGYNAKRQQLVLVQSGWDEQNQVSLAWRGISSEQAGAGVRPLLLEAPHEAGGMILCTFADSARTASPILAPRQFPRLDRLLERNVEAGQPTWWPGPVLAATFTTGGALWLLRGVRYTASPIQAEMILSGYRHDGGIITQLPLPSQEQAAAAFYSREVTTHLASVGNALLVGNSNRLVIRQGAAEWKELAFNSPIIGLVPTPPLMRAGCAVLLENGLALIWLDQLALAQTAATEIRQPLAAFTRQGTLVALGKEEGSGQVFEIVRGEARRAGDFLWDDPRPVALVGTAEREGFAVIDEGGSVQLFVR